MTPERVGGLLIGPRVVEREDSNPQPAVVVNRPMARADERTVRGDETVVDWPTNRGYSSKTSVFIEVFEDALGKPRPDQVGDGPIPPADLDAPIYAFPAVGLKAISLVYGPDDAPETEPEPPEELSAIAERLRAGGYEVEVTPESVEASKLGQTSRVHKDGTVEGDGMLPDRLMTAVRVVLARHRQIAAGNPSLRSELADGLLSEGDTR